MPVDAQEKQPEALEKNTEVLAAQKKPFEKTFAVKIYTAGKEYNYAEPWKGPGIKKWTGSGFVINENQIVTNAHVAGGAAFIEVQLANDTVKYQAAVKAIGHDCDLSILEVDDPEFWAKTKPAKIGENPDRKQKVEVHGFPTGGKEYCITGGIVSRSENDYYAHSGEKLLSTQTDAPINPGNSGGPVIDKKTGEVVGVAFQGLRGGQNIGYMIPASVLKHFIHQVEIQKIGFPGLAITTQALENKIFRKKLKLPGDQSGIYVTDVAPLSSAFGQLKEGDVILEINGKKIHNDGSIEVSSMRKVDWKYEINQSKLGDEVRFKVWREGKKQTIRFQLNESLHDTSMIGPMEYDEPPTYLLVGGVVVVQPVNMNYMIDTKTLFSVRDKTEPEEQLLTVNRVLESSYSQGYGSFKSDVIVKVNHKKVKNMRELADAVDLHTGKTHCIELATGRKIYVPNLKSAEIQNVLDMYGITKDRSKDLAPREAEEDLFDMLLAPDKKQPVLFSAGAKLEREAPDAVHDNNMKNENNPPKVNESNHSVRPRSATVH